LRGISPEEMAREAKGRSRFTEVIGLIDLSLGEAKPELLRRSDLPL
jgi:hypothetical protein